MVGDPNDPKWLVSPETARQLAQRILDAGTRLVRVEIRVDEATHGKPMRFRTVTADADSLTREADLNDSWLCPPVCPD